MKVLYGQRGQPVGSIDGRDVFLSDGQPLGEIIDDHLYKVGDGEWIGSVASGVIFNAYGAPQAFTADCTEGGIPPLAPRFKSALLSRLPPVGQDVRGMASLRPPPFLLRALPSDGPTSSRDGYFA